ncbi:hypothetical protein D3C81_1231970 [compost metagenome]
MRPAQPDRPEDRGRRLPGRTPAALLDSSGHRHRQEASAMDHGRRAGGDHQAVRAHGGEDRAGLAGAAGRASGEEESPGAALGEEARAGGGLRTGHLVWPDHRRPPRGALRPHRPAGLPRTVHPRRPGARRDQQPGEMPHGQSPVAGKARRTGSQGAPPRHPRRRGNPVRLLRSAPAGGYLPDCQLREMV